MQTQLPIIHPSAINDRFVHILGSRVHLVSAARTVDHIERWIATPNSPCRRVVVTGFHGLWAAYQDSHIRSVLNGAELWAPDGIAPIWLARRRGHSKIERAPGAEIMREFLVRADRRGYRSYFYGNTDATLRALERAVSRDYPGHKVVGACSPPFRPATPGEDDAMIREINDARPDVLWVSLGMPKQDIWIYERLDRLRVPVAIGVGAAFDFMAGTVPRCPDWIGSSGFEWVYRFCKEPKKLWRRDLLDGPRFLLHALLELIDDVKSD
jgi:N-acetylglucosaminyldiphosphoundecaprenol N-acetyl-beta-D-mannosaminyltransferase